MRQIGERDVWITAHAAIRDHAVIPMIATLDAIVGERIGGRDREEIADAGIVIDDEGVARQIRAIHLEFPAAARKVVFPRLPREHHAHTTIGIDAEDRDESVTIETEGQPDMLAACINGAITTVRPQLNSRTVSARNPDTRCRYDGQAEQRDMCEHDASRPRLQAETVPRLVFS